MAGSDRSQGNLELIDLIASDILSLLDDISYHGNKVSCFHD